ncbi:MAG: ribonuclease Z [Bacteroidales bacterium]|nr:ribonuclease Z [Bacteroidales bacterium]
MSFILTVLGSSSAIPTATRFPTAQVLNVHERFFMIDCGEGTQIQLRRFSLNMSRIRHIFISHLHGDHMFGLFGLFSTYNLMSRKTDLHVFAHRDFGPTLEHYLEYFGKDLTYTIIFHPFTANKPEIIFTDKHVSVQTIPLRHSVPVAGFIFREQEKLLNVNKEAIQKYGLTIRDIRRIKEGHDFQTEGGEIIRNSLLTLPPYKPRSYAFCTDTLCFKKLVNYLKDIDLLYFEATFSDKDKKLAKMTGHSTSVQAAELARSAGVGRLVMGHFSTRYKSTDRLLKEACSVFPDSYAAEDGDQYEVRLTRSISSPDKGRWPETGGIQ